MTPAGQPGKRMTQEDKPQENINKKDVASALIGVGKDAVGLLRDLALFVLAFLLLLFPGTFNGVLTKAGFEEGSLVGFKWKSKLVESDATLKEARTTITDLKTQLDKTSQALAAAQVNLNDPSFKDTVAKLEEENKKLNASSAEVEVSITNTIASNASLVEKAQTTVSSNAVWAVVFSGDATLDAAKYEVTVVASKLGIPNASVYFRQNSYRGVSLVESRTQAEQVLAKAKQRRADAYIVNISTWCPAAAEKDGYRECVDR
jgi:hypothetical protein